MKNIIKFLIISAIFISPVIIYYSAKSIWLLCNEKYKQTIYGNEVYKAIENSKKKTKHKKLILGDSTAQQFFNYQNNNHDDAYSLSCTQAIGMVGQFFLLNNYIKAGNRPDTVYLVYTPFSFWDNLDQVYTYHYFLKPFYYDEYKPLMTGTVMEQISKIPKYWACHIPYIQTTGWAPDIKPQERNYSFMSPISIEYLTKIDSLSKEYEFDLEIIPTYVANHWKDCVSHFKRHEYEGYNFSDKLKHYLEQIHYLPDSCFIDEVHLKHPMLYKQEMDSLLNIH